MRLGKRSEYGLRAAIQLAASFEEGFVQTREISRRESLPNKFLESILRSMTSAGLLVSRVGASGGYRLSGRPETITVGEMLAALEGEVVSTEVLAPPADPGNVERGLLCVHLVARRIRKSVGEVLDRFTLAELLEEVDRAQSRDQSMYYI